LQRGIHVRRCAFGEESFLIILDVPKTYKLLYSASHESRPELLTLLTAAQLAICCLQDETPQIKLEKKITGSSTDVSVSLSRRVSVTMIGAGFSDLAYPNFS
jgi:hypothetical protein